MIRKFFQSESSKIRIFFWGFVAEWEHEDGRWVDEKAFLKL